MCGAFGGTDQGGYRYVIGSKTEDVRLLNQKLKENSVLAEVVNRKWFREASQAPKWKLKLYFNYIYIKIPEELVQIFK